jgi:hypothetical protein
MDGALAPDGKYSLVPDENKGDCLRPMILALSLVLGILPLAGVAWIFASGMITISPFSATVDGLFMSLILLTLSGCFMLNAYWEARDNGLIGKKASAPAKAAAKAS